MKEMMKTLCGEIHIPTLVFCSGCLFCTSAHFPETEKIIREKWAVTGMIVMLLLCAVSVFRGKQFIARPDKVFKTFALLGVVEIAIVLLQLFRVLPSLHPLLRFTGSFRNPSVFAMMMALCLPICVFYVIRYDDMLKGVGKAKFSSTIRLQENTQAKNLWLFLTACVLSCIVLAESRTGIIAGVCSSFMVAFWEIPKFRSCLSNRKILFLAVCCGTMLLAASYCYKRDSADGRALIWAVSFRMIVQKPLLGWGENGFSSSYMPHQAIFLSGHEGTKFSYLADNVSHPLNEFLLFGVKYGVVGITILLGITAFLVKVIIKNRNTYTSLYLGSILTLFVLSMFYYPYTVPLIWLVSTFLICSAVSLYCNNSPWRRKVMQSLLVFSAIWIIGRNANIYEEWQWLKLQTSQAPVDRAYQEYSRLYKKLSTNPSFLYNYGAWLHHNGFYKESMKILFECTRSYDDYNVELLIADNYRQLGETKCAIERFGYANAMIPCRFLPLYHEMLIYKEEEDLYNACRIARIIITKPVKIQKSPSVRKIKYEAEAVLKSAPCDATQIH